MKNATGVCWQYRNSPDRGITWAAELRVGNALLCVHGQKNMKSAILIANKIAKRLDWKMVEPWVVEYKKDRIKSMNKRRAL